MGKVFVEEALTRTGINRTNLVGVITYLIRTKQASGQDDAVKQLESGKFDGVDFDELIISAYQREKPTPDVQVLDEDDGDHD